MLRSIGKQSGKPWSQSGRRKGRLRGKDLQKREVLSLEWKSEGVMDDESGELMELVEFSSVLFVCCEYTLTCFATQSTFW